MGKRSFKCLCEALEDRGYYAYRLDNDLFKLNGMKLTITEFVENARDIITNVNPKLSLLSVIGGC